MPEIERLRKKPLVVEALLWDGGNYQQVDDFTGNCDKAGHSGGNLVVWNDQEQAWIVVPVGHRVAKGALGELYPLSPQAYRETFEPAGDDEAREKAEFLADAASLDTDFTDDPQPACRLTGKCVNGPGEHGYRITCRTPS